MKVSFKIYIATIIFMISGPSLNASWGNTTSLLDSDLFSKTADPYYQLESFTVDEIELDGKEKGEDFFIGEDIPTDTLPLPLPKPSTEGPLDSVIMVIDRLIALGEKILPMIEKGRPVVINRPMAAVSVLPRLEGKDIVVHDMEGWSIPQVKHYRASFKNLMGMEVVSFVYSVIFQYGGSLNGKGKYLTGIRASARNIKVNFGFDLDASSELIQISNVGTGGNLVAGATVEITYTVKNMLKAVSTYKNYFISGDGKIISLDD